MTAVGRKQPFDSAHFRASERPVLSKADIQIRILKIRLLNGRIGPRSGRSLDMIPTGCL